MTIQTTRGPAPKDRPSGPQGEHISVLLTGSIADQILELHAEGYTPLQIADMVPVSRPAVYYHLRKGGVTPNRSNNPELSARQVENVLRAWNAGEPVVQIARRYGVTPEQVRYRIQKAIEVVEAW